MRSAWHRASKHLPARTGKTKITPAPFRLDDSSPTVSPPNMYVLGCLSCERAVRLKTHADLHLCAGDIHQRAEPLLLTVCERCDRRQRIIAARVSVDFERTPGDASGATPSGEVLAAGRAARGTEWGPERPTFVARGFLAESALLREVRRKWSEVMLVPDGAPRRVHRIEDLWGYLGGSTMSRFDVMSVHFGPRLRIGGLRPVVGLMGLEVDFFGEQRRVR